MANDERINGGAAEEEEAAEKLPPGVRLLRTFEGHQDTIWSIAFDPSGALLASGSGDDTVKLWAAPSGELLGTLRGDGRVYSVAFDPEGKTLASGSRNGTINLWDAKRGKLLRTLETYAGPIYSVAFGRQGATLAAAGLDKTVKLWDVVSGKLFHTLLAHSGPIYSLAFDPQGTVLVTGSQDATVKLWDVRSGELLRTFDEVRSVLGVTFDPRGTSVVTANNDQTVKVWDSESGKLLRMLEGHTTRVDAVAFSSDGRLLSSKSADQVRLWNCETWETVATVAMSRSGGLANAAIGFHPTLPLLAVAGTNPGSLSTCQSRLIYLWELDYDTLLGQRATKAAAKRTVHHTTAKIVLVGDHSVGKSALGCRLIHGRFEKQESTHGQQFWVFPALGKRRPDGTECEAIVWDFAGQPDYRLVHALFVDNADLALVLFDAADIHDPLHGVGFWLKQLQTEQSHCPILLVAGRSDRGTSSLTQDELKAFCQKHGIIGPVTTSAVTGEGIDELVERMKGMIAWEDKPATVTTATFKRIKDYVLGLKETKASDRAIVTPEELRSRLQTTDAQWQFTDGEMLTAVGHLENYGYVKRLKTSKGETRILLQPERLNNLASSFVLEARRHPKGLGALEERRLLVGGYDFPELKDLTEEERDVLLDSAALLFLEHNVCFRETDPQQQEPYLVFPELINLKKPVDDDAASEDGVAYTVTGPTENVFASLVVLLGYTHMFTRTAQWQNNARYEMGEGLLCGFRQEAERDGELDFVLCFASRVEAPVRTLFQGLFESFLARRNLSVRRFEPVRCNDGHLLDRSVVRQRMKERKPFAFCNDCGEKLRLPAGAEPIQSTLELTSEVEAQRRTAEQRTDFEQAVFRVRAWAAEQKVRPPECFISYSWGVPEHERWVEKRLAKDLQKAGIAVVLDRWDNTQIGASVARFVERIEKSDRIVMVGTPLYRRKYDNKDASTGFVVAAEVDLINNRLLGTEAEKETVLPLLLVGEKKTSLPPLLHGRVYADFRDERAYFIAAFDLILSLYQLPPTHLAVVDLRESLREPGLR